MTLRRGMICAAIALICFLGGSRLPAQTGCGLRFRIVLPSDAAPQGARGRMLVFMSDQPGKYDLLTTGFVPGEVAVAAAEVDYLAAGAAYDFNPDEKAFPHPFSKFGKGNYQFMALLDADHSFAYSGLGPGDLYSPVLVREAIDPASTTPVELRLSRTQNEERQADTAAVKLAEFRSPLLSAFWGRPIIMRAGVVLPPSWTAGGKRFPAVYHVHGFGGDFREAWYRGPGMNAEMNDGKRASMVHVFLDGSFPTGHHEFADSVNNGPWGKALVTEFVPWLENSYQLEPAAYARFLTGHSSGGWSTLWLQVSYPDFFGGTWSTGPDPVDFRSFTGIDVTPGSSANMYRAPDGAIRNLVREHGRDIASFESFARQEEVLGEYGGQLSSFEWVFSPRGQDGRPMPLFNRSTGRQDPLVQEYWRNYDIRYILASRWNKLGPALRGKIHVICGAEDTFHLETAVTTLCALLKEKGSDATCELVPGRDHMNLYSASPSFSHGLEERIDKEIKQSYLAHTRGKAAAR
jgi:hypothetical protein